MFESTNREIDGAVIGAFAEMYNDDGFFAPTSENVAKTIKYYNQIFCMQYTINTKDT